jgi:hypothetical protein
MIGFMKTQAWKTFMSLLRKTNSRKRRSQDTIMKFNIAWKTPAAPNCFAKSICRRTAQY